MKMTAHIITEDSVALGMNEKYGVRKLSAKMTNKPTNIKNDCPHLIIYYYITSYSYCLCISARLITYK